MRRRAPEFRRPARRRLSDWIWWLLGIFVVAGLLLFVVHHHHQDRFGPPIRDKGLATEDIPYRSLNLTQELLSSTSFARQLADQMTLAKAYVVIAKEHSDLQLAWELSSQIRNCQRLLSQAAVRGKPITQEEAHPVVSRLAQLIYKAQDSHYDISTMIITLKNHAVALEERANAAIVQSAEFGQLAAEAMPRSLHCFNIKLTEEWFRDPALRKLADEHRNTPRLVDNNLYHFCIFSDNVLSTSVVVNSTVSNAEHPQQLVFHVVTDEVNYRAMVTWFLRNDFKGCTIEVRRIEEFSWLNGSYSPLVKQLSDARTQANYFMGGSIDQNGETKFGNSKFASLLNHLRFYIPQIHPLLEKVVFLDDDVVVQKDLTPLFSVELHGNVIGAVETCLESFHRFYKYLNFSNPLISSTFDPQACGWAFGMNIFDLIAWKKANVTAKYHYWQEQNADQMLWKTGILPPGLLAFYGLVEPLDRRWHVLGLGYDLDIDDRLIESAAVVHYNGNLKPWLKLAISRYKHLWNRYANSTHLYLKECISH
ncbi:hexosyltransferase GAUT11-like [Phoenix dactylifera]|uniref:Hexosyltransferase n=1 Tax=Phoenix dactylifera TaxID=42345 RepID=A0A8B7D1W2_PHODC|nr:hexosyltransferase GAUT11-like [Phoenix dactylifera]XP_038983494.1 hexosyltransferase GAUT11-like [Phoenix dactylifera]